MWKEINLITGNRFFGGPSDQEKAAEGLYNEVGGINATVKNRFDNYKNPYGFEDVSGKLDEVFSGMEDTINRTTTDQIDQQQQDVASSMASRGIIGGSVLTDTKSKIASDVNRSKTNALSNLGVSKSKALADLMEYFNGLEFGKTKAASDIDFGNIENTMNKYKLKGGALGGLSDDTWFDDVLGIANTAANFIPGGG